MGRWEDGEAEIGILCLKLRNEVALGLRFASLGRIGYRRLSF